MLRYIGTAYTEDSANFVASCRECFEDIWNGYQDMWQEYYEGQMCGYSYKKAPAPVGIYETM
jgi:hypothetical protein